MYDIVFIGKPNDQWERLKSRFPLAKQADTFDRAKKKVFTKMFWAVWDDIIVDKDFDFSYDVSEWDDQYVHVFLNNEYFDGVSLFPKNTEVSQREAEYRFFKSKKEISIQASSPRPYDRFFVDTYEDYQYALANSITDMFWIIPKEVEILDTFKFDMYFSHHNVYNRKLNHVFLNQDVDGEKYTGVMLMSKHKPVSKREIDFRFLVEKKQYSDVASKLKPYDIVFISYNEPNADDNYAKLLQRFPKAKRVDKVKGIHQAHIEAAKLSETHMFWVVDGDAVIVPTFDFDYLTNRYDREVVHVWQSQNPVNGLTYGYGGVKLLPRQLTLDMDTSSVDMTTSISKLFKSMPEVSNITAFNTDAFSAWRSAFRECCKLAVINNEESLARLYFWCKLNTDIAYGAHAYIGAIQGRQYGEKNASDPEALAKINDFNWLQDLWQAERSQLLPEHMQ